MGEVHSQPANQDIFTTKLTSFFNKGTDINITWQEFIAAGHCDNPKKLTKPSDYVMKQQNSTLGHIIRNPDEENDPMKTITLDSNIQMPGVYFKRVGRPRYGWVKENCRWVFESHRTESYDPKNQAHDDFAKSRS